MNKKYINKNLIISPLSAYQVLGLTANGARGQTLKEMLLALGNQNLEG
jgi:serine protease inhibitor